MRPGLSLHTAVAGDLTEGVDDVAAKALCVLNSAHFGVTIARDV